MVRFDQITRGVTSDKVAYLDLSRTGISRYISSCFLGIKLGICKRLHCSHHKRNNKPLQWFSCVLLPSCSSTSRQNAVLLQNHCNKKKVISYDNKMDCNLLLFVISLSVTLELHLAQPVRIANYENFWLVKALLCGNP